MSTKLEDLSADQLVDLGRVRKVPGHNDMTRDELLEAMDGPVDDDLAGLLGKTRKELYAMAGEAGIADRMDMQKWELLEALADKA